MGRFIDKYIDDFNASGSGEDVVTRFDKHAAAMRSYLAGIPREKTAFRYAPGKWTVQELIGHVTDTHLVFLYRMVAFARGEQAPLPGFDEDAYVAAARFGDGDWSHMLAAYNGLTAATAGLIRGIQPESWTRLGTASQNAMTPLDILQGLVGHEMHHMRVLRERYGLA